MTFIRINTLIATFAAIALSVVVTCKIAAAGDEKQDAGKPEATGQEKAPPDPPPEAVPTSQEQFIKAAMKRGHDEIKLAELAALKAQGEALKELAGMLAKEHTAALDSLRGVAGTLNVKLDEALADAASQKPSVLSALSGNDFDEAFLREMSASHSKSITLYNAGRGLSKSAELTSFIDKTLPVIQTNAKKIADLIASRSTQKPVPARPSGPRKDSLH